MHTEPELVYCIICTREGVLRDNGGAPAGWRTYMLDEEGNNEWQRVYECPVCWGPQRSNQIAKSRPKVNG